MTHGQHAQSSQLLGRVEDDRRETRGHFRVETNLDTRLNLVLAFDEEIEKLLSVDHRLAEVRHQANERRVPLVDDLGERGGAGRHEDLTDAVVELLHRLIVDAEEALRRALLCDFILQVPDAVAVVELFVRHAALGQNATLESGHVEQQVRVILGVDADETAFPLDGRYRTRETILDVPEDGAAQVDVVFHQTHAGITRPAFLVVVADDVLVVGIRMLRQVALDEVARFFGSEAEVDVDTVDVARVQADGMGDFRRHVLENQEIVGHLRRSGHFRGALQTQHQQVQHQTEVLGNERGELKASDDAVRVRVVHIFVVDDDVILGRHVIGNVVIDDESQQSIEQGQIDFLVQFLEARFQHDVTLSVRRFPNILTSQTND